MTDTNKGPEGWDAEEYEREKIRELREQGLDPGSAQEKLKSLGHPSGRSLGRDTRSGDVEAPASGAGPGEPQIPGGEEHEMAERGAPTGGHNRPHPSSEREGG